MASFPHRSAWALSIVTTWSALAAPATSWAQERVPACDGTDAAGASAAFEEGNTLLTEATSEARARRRDEARALAAQALEHFDRQCRLGDDSGLAERAAALMLMGEPLRSAQSYDAFLQAHPLGTLDTRTRRRIEANLQPGSLTVELRDASAGAGGGRLVVDDLDFGSLERRGAVRLPYGTHAVEARDARGAVIASIDIAIDAETPGATFVVELGGAVTTTGPVRIDPDEGTTGDDTGPSGPEGPIEDRVASAPTDYTVGYAITGASAGIFLALGIGLQVGADERARTYNEFCPTGRAEPESCAAIDSEWEGLLGGAVASYVVAGIAAIGLGVVLALDLSQPREGSASLELTCAPSGDGRGLGVGCAGTF